MVLKIIIGILSSIAVSYAGVPVRQIRDIRSMSVMVYNVENLMHTVGKYERVAGNKYERRPEQDTYQKKPQDIQSIRKIIAEHLPDFVVLEEVEDIQALNQLLSGPELNLRYNPYLIEGNDPRGIDVAMIVRNDLPFHISYETHKHIKWFDPVEKQTIPLFSRDLPAALIRLSPQQNPFLIILGKHAKSQRDRPGDPRSSILRTAQFEMASKIIQDYQSRYAGVKIILGGDFNTDTRKSGEVDAIKRIMTTAFDLSPNPTPPEARITHSYHPQSGRAVYSQLDDIMVTREIRVSDMRIIRYRDAKGNVLPLPKTYEERSRQPSDHFPLVMRMDTNGLW